MRDLPLMYRQNFFAGLPISREIFMRESQKCVYEKNSMIFREWLPGDTCYYIHSGLVRRHNMSEEGKEVLLSMHYPGALFGLEEIVGGFRRRSNATAAIRTTLYVLKRKEYLSLLWSNPDFSTKVLCLFSRKVLNLEGRHTSRVQHKVRERLIHFLLFYHETMPEIPFPWPGLSIPIYLSQQDIADMIGSTQCTVSHILQQLCEEGLLEVTTKRIIILDASALWDKVFRRPLGDMCS